MTFKITFLGTGGGRHTAMFQTRCTGGMLIEHNNGKHVHVDPGPGALTQMKNIHYDPASTDSIIISHAHPDHCSDASVVIEGMTRGGWVKRGCIYGSPSVLEGAYGLGPCLSDYHISRASNSIVFRPGDCLDVDGMSVKICRAVHSDPTNVGFMFDSGNGIVSYVSDTEYSDELADQYIGSRILILPVTTPDNNRIDYHMCTEDAKFFVDRIKPELTIFVHLGIVMLKCGADKQAEMVSKETGCTVISGKDRMILEVTEESISISEAESFDDIWFPDSAPVNH
jgi:phosphoribosyl 1,2-cyclic phosphodiesterase